MKEFNIDRAYSIYSSLDKQQRKMVIKRLNAEGISVSSIHCHVYKEAPGIKHLCLRFKSEKEEKPYFVLEKEKLSKIQEIIDSIGSI